jgi:hypothetical protein
MAMIPTTGPVSFSQLQAEYGPSGTPNDVELDDYYRNNGRVIDSQYNPGQTFYAGSGGAYTSRSRKHVFYTTGGVQYHSYGFYWGSSTTPVVEFTFSGPSQTSINSGYLSYPGYAWQQLTIFNSSGVMSTPWAPTSVVSYLGVTVYTNYVQLHRYYRTNASTSLHNQSVPVIGNPISLSQFRGQQNP